MKTLKLCSLFFFILNSLFLSAQVDKVKYLLSYNNDSCYYDAYIVIEAGSASNVDDRVQLNTQFSLVVEPGTVISMVRSYMPLIGNELYNGGIPMNWILNTDYQEYPVNNPLFRFYGIHPNLDINSRYNDLYSSDTVKIFSIKIDTFVTNNNIRLWDNTTDPQSSAQGMEGRDFNNGITIGSTSQLYNGIVVGQLAVAPSIIDVSTQSSINLEIQQPNQCNAPYSYLWLGPNGFSSTTKEILISNAQPLNNGSYCCFITNSIGKIDTLCIDICKLGCSTIIDTTFCSPGVLILDSGIQGSTWQESASNPSGAVVSNLGDGLVEITFGGAASGLYTLYYNDGGFVGFMKINVPQTSQLVYTGPRMICESSTTTVIPSTGGVWTSSNPIVASVSNAGIVTGLSQGIATLTHTSSNGCSRNLLPALIVNPGPTVAITGPSEICIGGTTTLSPTTGGKWVSSIPTVASVTDAGVVTGFINGTTVLSFTSDDGCSASFGLPIVVNDLPTVLVTGSTELCIGDVTTISPMTDGTWTNHTPQTLQLNNFPISVVGLSMGVGKLTFNSTLIGCSSDTLYINVHARPQITLQDTMICAGGNTFITPNSGGTWSSAGNSVASITNAGTITGIAPGYTTFMYTETLSGCSSAPSKILKVTSGPTVAITGPSEICIGGTTTLSPTTGGTWTSTNPAVATVTNSGVVTGITNGSVRFSFTQILSGCSSTTEEVIVGQGNIFLNSYESCIGDTIDLLPASGMWSSSDPNIVQILPGYKAVCLAAGSVNFNVDLNSNLCGVVTSEQFIVHPQPVTSLSTLEACVGSPVTITPYGGGSWQSTNNFIATVTNSGQITLIDTGKVSFIYTKLATGCKSDIIETLTVVPSPSTFITGPTEICIGETTTLSSTTEGTWTSTNPSVASVTNSGVVTGISNGTTKFAFIQDIFGCEAKTEKITVGEGDFILNSYSGCIGDTIDLLPATGMWSSSDPNIVQILPGYKAVCLAEGQINFSVDLSSSLCGGVVTSDDYTVHPKPVTILSTQEACVGSNVIVTPITGGTWQSSDPNIAKVNNNGQIILISPGRVSFIYTKTSTGCVSAVVDTLTVLPIPSVVITGLSDICIGETTTLSPTTGGTWVSSNPAIATVTNSGIVTGVSNGVASFVFTDAATTCSNNATLKVSVRDYSIIKYDTLGLGNLIALDTLIPGVWTSSDTSILKILDNHTAIVMKEGDVLLYFEDETNLACGDKKIYVHVVAKSTKVNGYTFRDVNNNEVYDLNIDTPLPNFPVTNTTLGLTSYSDQFGFFTIRIENDESLSVEAPYGQWDSLQVYRFAKISSAPNDIILVGFYPSPSVINGMVNMSSEALRCNTNVKLNASVFNSGNEMLSGKLVVDLGIKTSLASSNPLPTSNVGTVYTWEFQNLKPGFIFAPDIRIYVANPALVGPKLSFNGYLVDTTNDTLSHKFFEDDILCSYDPNDKRSWPDREGEENLTLRTEHIDYMVRFQNTGNAEAYRVELVDVLPKGLDKMSMMILENSHDMETQMIGDTLKFIFNDINLPDSMSNPEGSQGYVLFSFKSEEGIAENTVLSNTASIYFDENAPIITNTVINTIVTSILCHEDTIIATICPGETFLTANNEYSEEGIYSERIFGADGCDTIHYYNISFNTLTSDSIWYEDGAMYVGGQGFTYDWYECERDSFLYTTVLPSADVTASGIYGAIIHGDPCDVVTDCIIVVINGTNNPLLDEISVYPNPASDLLFIKSPCRIASVSMTNAIGQQIYSGLNGNEINIKHLDNGVYYLTVSCTLGSKMLKVVIRK